MIHKKPLLFVIGFLALSALACNLTASNGDPTATIEAEPTAAPTPTPTVEAAQPTPEGESPAQPSPEALETPEDNGGFRAVPTLVTGYDEAAEPTAPPDSSALAAIQARGMLKVGVRYDLPPFGVLGWDGRVEGFDAALARKIAELWGVEIVFVQVNPRNMVEKVLSGEVDLLIAAVPHTRTLERWLAFTYPYYVDGVALLTLADGIPQGTPSSEGAPSGEGEEIPRLMIGAPEDLNGQPVGVEIGSNAADVLAARGIAAEIVTFPTLERAVAALYGGELAAVAGNDYELGTFHAGAPDVTTFIGGPLNKQPLAIAFRRHDANLRHFLDRTLQAVAGSGDLQAMHEEWLDVPYADREVWFGAGDDPRGLGDYATDWREPAESVVARIKAGQPLTVAGHPSDRTPTPVEAFFYGVVDQLQRRWNVQAVFLEGDSGVEQVASGEAVLAVNAVPRWDGADRVDYAVPLVGHGDRLMIAVQSDIESFHDLAGLTVGVFADEGGAADRVVALGKSVGVNVETRTLGSTDEARTAMISRDVTAVFGDGLRLMELVGANPDAFRLTDRSYAPRSMTFALKADDADFRALVNFTLQEMAQDGTLERLAAEAGIDSLLDLAVWPGDGSWLGVNMQPPG